MNVPCDRFQDCWKIVNKQQFDNSKQIIQQVSQKLGTLPNFQSLSFSKGIRYAPCDYHCLHSEFRYL